MVSVSSLLELHRLSGKLFVASLDSFLHHTTHLYIKCISSMHCKDGRRLEVSISVAIAPGRLSNYTKVVRICPRYVILNQLSRSIRLWQDSSIIHPNKPVEHSLQVQVNESEKWTFSNPNSNQESCNEYKSLFGEKIVISVDDESLVDTTAHQDACYIATIHPSELHTFHLPDTRIDRLMRIDYGSSWNLSSSFPADVTGIYDLTITRAMDLRLLPQVSSRAAPVYTVTLPPRDKEWNGELGAYFETDWDRERSLIVKGVREGSFASYWTDITVGDELVSIDGIPVEEYTFEDAMKLLKSRLSATKDKSETLAQFNRHFQQRKKAKAPETSDHIRLTFMTLEERMRNLRRKALMGRVSRSTMHSRRNILSNIDSSPNDMNMHQTKDLRIDMKFLFQSIFVFVHERKTIDPPHIIRNRSLQWAVSTSYNVTSCCE